MPCRIPRHLLQRVSDRKIRKLAVDDSDSDVVHSSGLDSQLEVVESSQSSLKGYRDLFGEFIPFDAFLSSTSKAIPENKSVMKARGSKKKHQRCEKIQKKGPPRVFPTPKIIKIMQNAQTELYSLMGHNSYSTSDVSVESDRDLNVSGIHHLLDSPVSSKRDENDKETRAVLKGKFDTYIKTDNLGPDFYMKYILVYAHINAYKYTKRNYLL